MIESIKTLIPHLEVWGELKVNQKIIINISDTGQLVVSRDIFYKTGEQLSQGKGQDESAK